MDLLINERLKVVGDCSWYGIFTLFKVKFSKFKAELKDDLIAHWFSNSVFGNYNIYAVVFGSKPKRENCWF